MSRLEELIQQYCPDGVEYVPLSSIADLSRGKVISKDYIKDNGGDYPVYSSQSENEGILGRINSYMYDGKYLTWTTDGAYAGTIFRRLGKFNITNVCGLVKVNTPNVSMDFLYYWLYVEAPKYVYRGMGNPKLMSNVMGAISVPVPPLPVQEEIVRILDNFTELQAELQAELQKRLQQYEYYKWNIFEGLSCPTKHITDVALVKARVGWQRLTTAEYQETGDYYLITGTDFKNGKIDFNSCVFVSKERYEMDPNIIVGKGDILITKDGTLGKVAFMAEEPNKPTTLNSGVFRIHTTDPQVSSRYLFHYFTSKYFTDFVNSVKTGSTIPHLTQQGLVSLNIPIPSLEEQNRIVSILDRFDTLTNDLTAGLPAEIEKRRQQYEYYRDKLLTFKRKGA